jgi:DNA-binding XRE family transcriptional regulator
MFMKSRKKRKFAENVSVEANEFKLWRQRFNLTQEDVSLKFRVSRTTVQNWESGATPITQLVEMSCETWEPRLRQEDPDFGPVTLIYTDGPMFVDPYAPRQKLAMMQQEPHPSNAAALARVQKLWGQSGFCNPFILDKETKPLWNFPQLRRVVESEDPGAPTVQNLIRRIAREMKANSGSTVWGANRPNASEKQERKQRIEALANQLEAIADSGFVEIEKRRVEVEDIIYKFQHHGTRAPDAFVHNLAQAFTAAERL